MGDRDREAPAEYVLATHCLQLVYDIYGFTLCSFVCRWLGPGPIAFFVVCKQKCTSKFPIKLILGPTTNFPDCVYHVLFLQKFLLLFEITLGLAACTFYKICNVYNCVHTC